ncbi:hypothetical protein JMJ77_0002007 [Colletotrichum scovillei]|uniref:Uncharacterized protein n=1 Tax=Colletotrichum scovillei TaxID=1209932 RepID=A0A9P7R8U0_9PEZI|nr:hypothetical protein JMJ77_0002007 [Colletotrichum scovillei]KAG7070420.1 hypothetical protein JMJ76_0001673 [Colletotrichum scovillei]
MANLDSQETRSSRKPQERAASLAPIEASREARSRQGAIGRDETRRDGSKSASQLVSPWRLSVV